MLKYFSNIYNLYWKHKSFLPKKQYSCFGQDLFIKDFLKMIIRVITSMWVHISFGIIHIYFTKKIEWNKY